MQALFGEKPNPRNPCAADGKWMVEEGREKGEGQIQRGGPKLKGPNAGGELIRD